MLPGLHIEKRKFKPKKQQRISYEKYSVQYAKPLHILHTEYKTYLEIT